MNELCILSSMSSCEWASWVQAVGSIAAILGSVGIAVWQSRQQHKASLDLLRTEKRMARIESAKAFFSLGTGALRLLQHTVEAFPDRDSVIDTAEGRKFFDFGELKVIESAVQAISLHTLPHELVRLAMIVSSTVRQFRENIEFAMQHHRTVDAEGFTELFVALSGSHEELGTHMRRHREGSQACRERGLTLPSRGRFPAFGLQGPPMSNVRAHA